MDLEVNKKHLQLLRTQLTTEMWKFNGRLF